MPMTYDDVLEYAHSATQDECMCLAKTFREYSQIPVLFRNVWDMFIRLPEERRKIAIAVMESSLIAMYTISKLK